MKIILQEKDKLRSFNLTKEVIGNFWISDSNKNNIVNIEADDGKWILKSNIDYKILKDVNYKEKELLTNINQLESIELIEYLSFYIIELLTNKIYKIYCMPFYDNSLIQLVIDRKNTKNIVIGNNKSATINCSKEYFSKEQIVIDFQETYCTIKNNNLEIPMFINNIIETEKILSNGDMVFIDGIIIYIIGNLLLINNPNNCLFYDSLKLAKRILPQNKDIDYQSESEVFVEAFSKSEYFQRPPRFKRMIEKKSFDVDPPTQSEKEEEMPIIYTIGPMMLMGVTSLISGLEAIMNVVEGKSSFKENMAPIITCIAMLGSMVLFPFLQLMYKKFADIRKERKRRKKYKKYVNKKKEEILQEIEIQRQILIENNLPLDETARIILNKGRLIRNRKIEDPDFLSVRLGIGTVKPEIEIKLPEEHFTMDEDNLRDVYQAMFDDIKNIENVPVTVNLINNKITGIVGEYNYVKNFIDGFMLQILAYHSYDMLKIAVISSNEKKNTWEKYRNIPHFWNNEKSFRFMGINADDVNSVSNTLVQILNERYNNDEDEDKDKDKDNQQNAEKYKNYKEYYLIISDEVDYLKNTTIFNELINKKTNYGFSMVIITDKVDELPNECTNFINIAPNNSGLFENELLSTNQIYFEPDIPNFNLNPCYISLCNIPIDVSEGKFELPKQYSFLEMYNVGSVKQLNIRNKWKNNNPIQSLAAPVGINERGELFKIDLHEKYHGPHGLVAGMTGSGKSEWIITYVLSMCINYHPDEVQFVLIDYKGGGLAGTFENKETGFAIPHLAGTITNLDVAEINRSLASINSELKRRQALFNSARDKLGESSVDIYKYQRWYREGKIDEPISHLFLISDEFAELKAQQPEFMDELISTARIGRSLGVHLILATQKPSGVVNEQIWSNSKFRVCLKVQEPADSKEMILVPDAAYLKEVGRFYLQVGYNEFFAKGQSAYAGVPYYESDRHKKAVDTEIEFVNNIGDIFKQINTEKKIVSSVYKGEELPNILKEIVEVGKQCELHVKKLWLDAIPAEIFVDDLLKKYQYKKENYVLNPIIGEYDAPQNQKQNLLTLPLDLGNTIIYGLAGSGKENLLQTMIYSLELFHFSKEVNIYIIDCGAELLNCFRNSPIVGDIMNATEEEKIKNCFKFLNTEYERRKKLFQDYNGSYEYFIKNSQQSLPNILVILNNYDNFNEVYDEKYGETLVKLTRETEKFGIKFIMTALSSNSVRFKLSQNFRQSICLQMKETFDYYTILGNTCKVVPSAIKGRGVVKINKNFYEFQTAYPKKVEDTNEYLVSLSKSLLEKYKEKAQPIKILPSIINYNYMLDKYNDEFSIPIGMYVESLDIFYYNFFKNKLNIVMSDYSDTLYDFNKSCLSLVENSKFKYNIIVFDGLKEYEYIKEDKKILYINDNFKASIEQIIEKIKDMDKSSILYFIGLQNIIQSDMDIGETLNKNTNSVFAKDNVSVIISDTVSGVGTYKSDMWYTTVNPNEAIYIGDKVADQYVFAVKNVKNSKNIKQGYFIKKGYAAEVKLISSDNNE